MSYSHRDIAMLTLNNPLVLISAKLLGIGIQITFDHVDGIYNLCFEAEAVAWKYCKEWTYVS